jgi:hypothetical protein
MRVQDIQITNVVVEDTACPENGRIARDANGTPLFCQSGRWSYATVSGGRYVCADTEECGFTIKEKIEGDIAKLYFYKRNDSKKTQWFIVGSDPKEGGHGACNTGGYVTKEAPERVGVDVNLKTNVITPSSYGWQKNGEKGCSVVIPVPPGEFGILWVNNVNAKEDGSKLWRCTVSIYE